MGKIATVLVFMLFIGSASHSQVRVGPFLGYGDGPGLWGIGAYAEIVLNDRMSVSGVFTQYFPEKLGAIPRRSGWELNTNFNYYVITGEAAYLYGLAGLNYTFIRTRVPVLNSAELVSRDRNVGFNLGIGTMVKINDLLYPFAEAKYTVGDYNQFTVIFGMKFQLGEGTLLEGN